VGFINIPILLIAKFLNTLNAKYIIAGFNDMSEYDRQKINVKFLVASTKKFLYLLAIIPFLTFIVLITTISLDMAIGGYCLVVTILICWFFVFTKRVGLR
jgi:hypothetical protein